MTCCAEGIGLAFFNSLALLSAWCEELRRLSCLQLKGELILFTFIMVMNKAPFCVRVQH